MSIISDIEDESAFGDGLAQWWRRKEPARAVEVVSVKAPTTSNGYSNDTYKLKISVDGNIKDLILRLPPKHVSLFPTYDLGRQYDFTDALHGKDGVPMPEAVAFEPDASIIGRPFFLMELVDGLIPSDNPPYLEQGWVVDASDDQRRRLWTGSLDAIAAISHVEPPADLLEKVDWKGSNGSRLFQLLDYYDGLRRWVEEDGRPFSFPLLDQLGDWLIRNAPDGVEPRIVWGDARPGNIIFRDFHPVALLDWELAYIGDPREDLSWFLVMQRFYERKLVLDGKSGARLGGFLDDAASVAYYNQRASTPVGDIRYFWLLSAYRAMCITQRFAVMLFDFGVYSEEESMRMRLCPYLYNDVEAILSDDNNDALFGG